MWKYCDSISLFFFFSPFFFLLHTCTLILFFFSFFPSFPYHFLQTPKRSTELSFFFFFFFLPFLLALHLRVLVVHYSLGFTAYKAESGGVFFRSGTPKGCGVKDYKAKPLVRRSVHPRILQNSTTYAELVQGTQRTVGLLYPKGDKSEVHFYYIGF